MLFNRNKNIWRRASCLISRCSPSSAISPLSTYNQMCLGLPVPRTNTTIALTRYFHCFFVIEVDGPNSYRPSHEYWLYRSYGRSILKRRPLEWNSGRQASHLAAICRPFRCTDHKWSPLRVTLTSREKTWKITLHRVKLSITIYL